MSVRVRVRVSAVALHSASFVAQKCPCIISPHSHHTASTPDDVAFDDAVTTTPTAAVLTHPFHTWPRTTTTFSSSSSYVSCCFITSTRRLALLFTRPYNNIPSPRRRNHHHRDATTNATGSAAPPEKHSHQQSRWLLLLGLFD